MIGCWPSCRASVGARAPKCAIKPRGGEALACSKRGFSTGSILWTEGHAVAATAASPVDHDNNGSNDNTNIMMIYE